MWVLTAQEILVPLDLMKPAMMVAAAQNKQQRKRFLSNAATFSTMQVGCMTNVQCNGYTLWGPEADG